MVVVVDSAPVTATGVVVVGKPILVHSVPVGAEDGPPSYERRQDENIQTASADPPRDGGAESRDTQKEAASSFWSCFDSSSVVEKDEKKDTADVRDPVENNSGTPAQEPAEPADAPHTKEPNMWERFVEMINPEIHSIVAHPVSNEPTPSKPADLLDDDDSNDESKLLGGSLQSLPSVNDGLSTTDVSLKIDDKSDGSKNLASVVESRAKQVKIPSTASVQGTTAAMKASSPKKNRDKIKLKSDESADTRRNLLVKELRHAISTYGRYHIRCANISAQLGDILDESDQHEQAIKLHKDSVTIYSCKLGEDNETTMAAKIRLARVLENAGRHDEAIDICYMVTSMRRSLLGDKDPSFADGLVQMAHILRKKSEYLLAIKELKRALKIYREALGDSHEKVSITVDEIASLYVTVGDFEKSSAILEEVVKLKAATFGTNSKDVAVTLSSLATSYECSENFDKAMKSLKKAYKIYTEIGGYSTEGAIAALNRMAQLYEAQRDYNRASIAFLGVLRGRKTLHGGEDHLSVGEVYYRLGHCLHETGQAEKALKCMKEALPIFVKRATTVSEVETIADIMHEMAILNKDRKQHAEAARIFKQELGVRRKIDQPEYPVIAKTLNHLGVVEYELSSYSRALKYLVEALTIYQRHGEDSLDCAEVLFNTGLVFEAVRKKDRALEAYSESALIFQKNGYSSTHPHLSRANNKVLKLTNNRPTNRAGRLAGGEVPASGSGLMKRLFK